MGEAGSADREQARTQWHKTCLQITWHRSWDTEKEESKGSPCIPSRAWGYRVAFILPTRPRRGGTQKLDLTSSELVCSFQPCPLFPSTLAVFMRSQLEPSYLGERHCKVELCIGHCREQTGMEGKQRQRKGRGIVEKREGREGKAEKGKGSEGDGKGERG